MQHVHSTQYTENTILSTQMLSCRWYNMFIERSTRKTQFYLLRCHLADDTTCSFNAVPGKHNFIYSDVILQMIQQVHSTQYTENTILSTQISSCRWYNMFIQRITRENTVVSTQISFCKLYNTSLRRTSKTQWNVYIFHNADDTTHPCNTGNGKHNHIYTD